jgi:hypothetical protein
VPEPDLPASAVEIKVSQNGSLQAQLASKEPVAESAKLGWRGWINDH